MNEFEKRAVELLERIVEQLEAIATDLRRLKELSHEPEPLEPETENPLEDIRHTGP